MILKKLSSNEFPDFVIEKSKGIDGQIDNIMKSVYRIVIDVELVKQNKNVTKHFDKISHKI